MLESQKKLKKIIQVMKGGEYENKENQRFSSIHFSKPGERKMKTKKLIRLFILASLVIVLTLQNVLAIGITPGRKTLNFEPGLHEEVGFSIINSEHKDMSVVFMVKGDLSESITLTQTYAEFLASEGSKSFSYTVDLPQKFDKPGKYEAEIIALEMPKDIKEQGAFVGATVAVVTQLHVYVPYPGKYIEAEVDIIESREEGKIFFLIPMINRGKLDIVNAKAEVDIYTSLNEKIVTLETDTESLNSLERKQLMAEWAADVNPGKYLAIATIMYDNQVTKVEKEFNIGEMSLQILEVIIRDFELGEIAKFNTLVENKWSNDLKEVYLNILVYNDEGEIMADFKSPTYDIDALSKSEMVSYWDTAGVKKGTYDGKIILKYEGKSTEKNIQLKITDDEIEVIGVTGHVIVKKKSTFNANNLLIILVIFLIVVNIVWFVIVKRLVKRKK